MHKGRLEAFSDGVIAIIITIMVLELKVPHGGELRDLEPLLPVFLAYVLSFVNVGIYWNNHHHLLQSARHVDAAILWSNLHLLFWLSLFPFATAWLGESHETAVPTAAYGVVLLMAGFAYTVLQTAIVRTLGRDSPVAAALGANWKGRASLVAYVIAIPLAFVEDRASDALYVAVALMWFVPDRRIERALAPPS